MAENLNFHDTFPPTPLYLGRILKVANGEERTINELVELTGIPQGASTGKIAPHIAYARYMGLLDLNNFRRTRLGHTILKEDGVFLEKLTQLVCHIRLTSASGASMWNYFFRELMPNNQGSISESSLAEQMQIKFGKAKYAPVITMYTKQFTKLNLLEKKENRISIIPMPIEKDMTYVYGYALLHEWELLYSEEIEITADQLQKLHFGAVFGWNSQQEYEVLQRLRDKGIIGLNNQLVPFTVKKMTNAEDLIPELYSLLF